MSPHLSSETMEDREVAHCLCDERKKWEIQAAVTSKNIL